MSHRETLNTVLADLARATGGPPDRHPSDDDLVAYEAGELAGEAYRLVQDHLLVCADCARLILELSLLDPRALTGEDPVSEHQIEQSLRRMRARLRPLDPVPRPVANDPLPAPFAHRASPARARHAPDWTAGGGELASGAQTGWYKALAAGLSVAVLGLAGWVGLLHSRRGGPEINTFVWSVSDTSTRGGTDQAEVVEVPAGSNAVTLILSASKLGEQDAASFSGFRVEVSGAGRAWSRDGLRVVGFDSFSVTLPKKEFPAGTYEVRILGARNGQQELLAEYALQLRYS